MFALLLLTILPVAYSGWLPIPENCWNDVECLTPYNLEKYPLTVKYDFTSLHSWMYARFWNGRNFVGAITWKYEKSNGRFVLKAYTHKCGWEKLTHSRLNLTPSKTHEHEIQQELIFTKEADYLSISIYAKHHDRELYRYNFDDQKCGAHWRKALYRISFYSLYSVHAHWYRYSVLGSDDDIGELQVPFQPVPEDCYQEYWCTADYAWNTGSQIQLQYEVTGTEDWLEVDVWRGEEDIGGIGWGYNSTDETIYVELYGYEEGCEISKIGHFPVEYVWGEQIVTFYKTEEYLTMFVDDEALFQHVFEDSQCHQTWVDSFDRLSFVFLEWVGATYR